MRTHSQRAKVTFTGRPLPKHHRIITLLTCLTLMTMTMCLISYFDWRERTFENRLRDEQAKQDAFIKAEIEKTKERRFALAREAERKARANSETIIEAMRNKVAPQGDPSRCAVTNSASALVITNKQHCLNPRSYEPNNLTPVDNQLMRADAAAAMVKMQADASAANAPFTVHSGYRSYSEQVITYNAIVAANGTATADTLSARPGYSEHQTGLAADLKVGGCSLDCFESTPAYAWLTTHAAEYGYIQRYQRDMTPITGFAAEAWHWRYIGKKVALDLKAQGLLTLEEYFSVTGGDYK